MTNKLLCYTLQVASLLLVAMPSAPSSELLFFAALEAEI